MPDEETEVFGRADYGYHLPALAYAGALKSLAVRRGVEAYQALDVTVERTEVGDVAAIGIGEGSRVTGDLFIDLEGLIDSPREAWSFPTDRVLTAVAPAFPSIPAYAEVRAWARGWTALHPAQNQTHIVQAYASDLCTDEEALQAASAASSLPIKDASVSVSAPSRRLSAWDRNVVAIGEAACVFDPTGGSSRAPTTRPWPSSSSACATSSSFTMR